MDKTGQRLELQKLARNLRLAYPIGTKSEFVRQVTESNAGVTFRGVEYDGVFAAGLIPAFFFPLRSEEDLLDKATELLQSRGMLPLYEAPGSAIDGSEP